MINVTVYNLRKYITVFLRSPSFSFLRSSVLQLIQLSTVFISDPNTNVKSGGGGATTGLVGGVQYRTIVRCGTSL